MSLVKINHTVIRRFWRVFLSKLDLFPSTEQPQQLITLIQLQLRKNYPFTIIGELETIDLIVGKLFRILIRLVFECLINRKWSSFALCVLQIFAEIESRSDLAFFLPTIKARIDNRRECKETAQFFRICDIIKSLSRIFGYIIHIMILPTV